MNSPTSANAPEPGNTSQENVISTIQMAAFLAWGPTGGYLKDRRFAAADQLPTTPSKHQGPEMPTNGNDRVARV
jgi:hypothetical protein